jgi:hypothetical protein
LPIQSIDYYQFQVVIVGRRNEADVREMISIVRQCLIPYVTFVVIEPGVGK